MLYNLYTVVSDPLKVWSIVVIALTPSLRWWGLALYLTYLAFEIYPYWVPGPLHVQLEVWDFVDAGTSDQFRPEVGVHLRDRRNSVYTLQWRH